MMLLVYLMEVLAGLLGGVLGKGLYFRQPHFGQSACVLPCLKVSVCIRRFRARGLEDYSGSSMLKLFL